MAIEATAINEDRLDALMGQVIGELGATVNAGLIVLGDRLGLYRPMAGAWPIRPGKLAQRTGTAERYVREWLNAQAAGGLVEYDPVGERYVLTAEQAMALADEDKPSIRRWGVPVRAPHAQGGRPHRIRLQGPHQHGLARA